MTKKKKREMVTVAVLAIILVIVGIGYVVSTKHNKAKEDKAKETINLLTLDSSLATEIDIKNDNGKIKFVKTDGAWVLNGDDTFTVDQDKINSLLDEFADVEAIKSVADNKDNLAEFGLDDPQAVGTVVLSDGTKATISFGSEVPSTDGGYYGMLEDNDGVYSFSADVFTSLFSDKSEFKGEVATASPDAAATEDAAASTAATADDNSTEG